MYLYICGYINIFMSDYTGHKYYQGCNMGQLFTIQIMQGAFKTRDMYAAGNIADLLNAWRENEHWMVDVYQDQYFIYNSLFVLNAGTDQEKSKEGAAEK